jgi:FkbM family methyltransferase
MNVLTLNQHRALIEGRDGYFLVNRHDFFIGKALETYGEYSQAEANLLATLVSEGDTVIEVGANIGAHTVGLAKRVGKRGRVYAYEPQRAVHALLQAQIALNQLDQVIAVAEGCGSAPGTLWHAPYDYDKLGNFGGVGLKAERQDGYHPVAVRRLDDAHRGEKVRLLKVDVEGMEREVLLGAHELVRTQQPILYLENDRPANSPALVALVREMGFRAWWHVCPLFNPGNHFAHAKNIYGTMFSFNMICLPAHMAVDANAFSGEVRDDKPHPLDAMSAKSA